MTRLTTAINTQVSDPVAERVRRNHEQRIKEIQDLPFTKARILRNVTLNNGTDTHVSHGADRNVSVFVTPGRDFTTIGTIDQRTSPDAKNVAVLRATGWGKAIMVDVLVI